MPFVPPVRPVAPTRRCSSRSPVLGCLSPGRPGYAAVCSRRRGRQASRQQTLVRNALARPIFPPPLCSSSPMLRHVMTTSCFAEHTSAQRGHDGRRAFAAVPGRVLLAARASACFRIDGCRAGPLGFRAGWAGGGPTTQARTHRPPRSPALLTTTNTTPLFSPLQGRTRFSPAPGLVLLSFLASSALGTACVLASPIPHRRAALHPFPDRFDWPPVGPFATLPSLSIP